MYPVLARFLSAIALCAMLGAPFARDAAASIVPGLQMISSPAATAETAMDEMPCCLDMTAERDCSKTCVLMAVCATSLMYMAAIGVIEATHVLVSRERPPGMSPLAGRHHLPAPRPPNSDI